MNRRLGLIIPLAAATMAPQHAAAQGSGSAEPIRVDDTGTFVSNPNLEMKWQPVNGANAALVTASTQVNVLLNVAPWIGRSARIYMALPRAAGPVVRASWQTGGLMLPGTVLSGERTLVFAGPIATAALRDVLNIRLEADGARLIGSVDLNFGFEIEIDQ